MEPFQNRRVRIPKKPPIVNLIKQHKLTNLLFYIINRCHLTPIDRECRSHTKEKHVRPQPYIGVTGFIQANHDLAQFLLATIRGHFQVHHHLMVGALASAKTLRGEQNKWPGRTPLIEDLASCFVNDPLAINLAHFATDDRDTIDVQLMQLMDRAGPFCDGVQLNMVWPNIDQLATAMLTKRMRRVVLQIGATAFRQVDENPQRLAERLDEYKDHVTDILFDLSGGHGLEMDSARAIEVLRAVRTRHPNLGTGVAGGLSQETIHLLAPIVKEFPNINIDAEGRLRTPQPEDAMHDGKAMGYVTSAIDLFADSHL
ncbi:hypothetical protein A3E97_04790 [Candidatus Uhrbacteria bacterium RIFCSPHIGHO2_12_FULL_47_12]|uniref:Phosphoribosylanthranilate isomerase n=1 Tax=Candidatus Uhrbacteria bacterium RIFCSPLOWO2_02_FULL_48_18 TaxID=1802408 RepID=A0A1F7V9G3_9BACT|nr:MAG: hypothetical protein A2839_02855 [Candidatus Uhrbacteria bacterium RIFCSPHIGHO2_01_FULL_47_10]OGL75957.1 MAG: hypothetical protein A3E97_04790 [Candidatus Uhrbacteria bacterium RIFCSPHIGHO2_12_FULL_47_12]OGL82248.1 MAG: hypothetical protein A3B20_00655 [Candidatus Uhrbacteria bacterium RIFCSPLOWO2_01_FULL_47_17]OGL86738.1 MAG: hypothetical protein A3I41_05420 [Candidatus Uhrbacteria bacterium RIFCSPLOWO2_02_FULL_48_18]OGL94402.1 MAG: hypothetical protein A3H12_03215 [Candidatus Uhrbacte